MSTIKSILFPGKEYATKEALFKDLRENMELILDAKKSSIQKSCDKGQSVYFKQIDLSKYSEETKAMQIDDNYYYIATNSTLILDSHDDMHDNGIWDKSVEEQQGKNYLVCDHNLDVLSTIVRKEHVEMFIATIPFKALNKPYSGNTQVLFYKVPKEKVTIPAVKEWLDSGDSIEASVRMQYIKILPAFDSLAPEDKEYKSTYDKYFNKIANKSDFEYIPYFFVIKEAKNVKESSLVLFGSNHATGVVGSQKNKTSKEAVKDTSTTIEPPIGTQTKQVTLMQNILNIQKNKK